MFGHNRFQLEIHKVVAIEGFHIELQSEGYDQPRFRKHIDFLQTITSITTSHSRRNSRNPEGYIEYIHGNSSEASTLQDLDSSDEFRQDIDIEDPEQESAYSLSRMLTKVGECFTYYPCDNKKRSNILLAMALRMVVLLRNFNSHLLLRLLGKIT